MTAESEFFGAVGGVDLDLFFLARNGEKRSVRRNCDAARIKIERNKILFEGVVAVNRRKVELSLDFKHMIKSFFIIFGKIRFGVTPRTF